MKKVNNQNRQNHHKIFLQFSQKIHTLLIAGNDTENSEIAVFLEIWYFLATLVFPDTLFRFAEWNYSNSVICSAVRNNRRLFADFSGICRDAEGLPDGTTFAPIRGSFRCVLLFSKAGSMIIIWNICIELYGLLSRYGNSCKGITDSHGRSADWSWEWQCYIYVDSLQQPMMLFAFVVSCG